MTDTDKKEDLFPAIGSLADKTDNLPDAEPTPNGAEGTLYTAKILSRPDLDRQIVRSPHCTIQIPELELTLPSTTTSQGQLTTVEGLVRDVVADLSIDQPVRRYQDPGTYEKIEVLIGRLKGILGDEEEEEGEEGKEEEGKGKEGVEGVNWESLGERHPDACVYGQTRRSVWEFVDRVYWETLEQNVALGLVAAPDEAKAGASQGTAKMSLDDIGEDEDDDEGAEGKNEEIFVFHGTCSSCGHPLDTLMKKVNIPYFKDVLIMSTNCDRCGYRDNEVKSGSAISEKGKKITLKVEDKDDMSRDILKSETAGLTIPEIDLVLTHGTLGGRFTTLEGILEQVYEELSEKVVMGGDSTEETERSNFVEFLRKLKEVKSGERPFTVILDDPLANSYIQNLYAPDPDPGMEVEVYERTWEQNESLGLNDMKVEGYEEDHEKEKEKVAS
ncbi:nucleolar zinc-finger protein [Marasmius sp. AFHP31]|nr:nucleolar zinc-finger protein [Marasmius sp. AFHP31]